MRERCRRVTLLLAAVAIAAVSGGMVIGTRLGRLSAEVIALAAILLVHALAALILSMQGGISILSGSATRMIVDASQTAQACWIFLNASATVVATGLLLSVFTRKSELSHLDVTRLALPLRERVAQLVGTRVAAAVLFGLLVLVVTSILITFDALVDRTSYQFAEKGALSTFLLSISLPAGILSSVFLVASKSIGLRVAAGVLLVLSMFIEFSRASRSLAVLFVAAAVVTLLLSRRRLWRRLVMAILLLVVGATSLLISLQIRGASMSYGFVPFWGRLWSGEMRFDPLAWASVANNVLASIPISYLSAQLKLPDSYLATSLSPLPGTSTDWYDIAPYLSIAQGVPTSAVGQLAALGFLAYLGGWSAVVFLLTIPSITRRGLPPTIAQPASWVSIVIASIASLQLVQYSLRAASRFVWLAAGIAVLIWLIYNVNGALAHRAGRGRVATPGNS